MSRTTAPRGPTKPGRLRVSLLGPPRIERAGEPIEPETRKATALLAYLAVTGRAEGRDRLAALLWPDSDEERARGAFRRTLSTLRTVLGGEHLMTDGVRVALEREGLDCDVHRFHALIAAGRLAEAVDTYTGDLLSGFSLRDSVEFDEWQSAESEALRRELAGILERLAHEERDNARAIEHARRWLSVEPLNEAAHRALMRLYARSGDRAAALRQYRECARVLDRELGIASHRDTIALRDAIERGDAEPEPGPSAPNIHERVGDLYTQHGEYSKAIVSYEAALVDADPATRPAIEHKLADVHHRRGDWEQAEARYRAALRGEENMGRRARITGDWSLAAHRRGDTPRAIRLAEEALTLAKRTRDDHALAQAHNILGILTGERRHLEQSLAIAERIDDATARVAALNNLALAHGRTGDVERAIELTRAALEASAAIVDRHREAALHNNLADLLHRAGREEEAMRELKRAVMLFAEIGEPVGREPEIWKLVEW